MDRGTAENRRTTKASGRHRPRSSAARAAAAARARSHELHVAHAAERLRIAAPSLSQQIKSLQASLGTPLFGDTIEPASMRTSPAGLTWLASADPHRDPVRSLEGQTEAGAQNVSGRAAAKLDCEAVHDRVFGVIEGSAIVPAVDRKSDRTGIDIDRLP